MPVPLALHVPTVLRPLVLLIGCSEPRAPRTRRRGHEQKALGSAQGLPRAGVRPRVAVLRTAPGLIFTKIFVPCAFNEGNSLSGGKMIRFLLLTSP